MNPDRGQITFAKNDQKRPKNLAYKELNHEQLKRKIDPTNCEKKFGILRKAETNQLSKQFDFEYGALNKKFCDFNMHEQPLQSETIAFRQLPTQTKESDSLHLISSSFQLTETLKKNRPRKTSESAKCSIKLKTDETINTPYWLRPTPVQIYPYNFIMAIRKKLDSITNPSVTDANTPLARPKYFQKKSVFRENLNKEHMAKNKLNSKKPRTNILEKFDEQKCEKKISNGINSKKYSNTAISKKNSKSIPNKLKTSIDCQSQDTLSMSSAIFSQSNPRSTSTNRSIPIDEPIPLSTGHLDAIKITSKSNSFVNKTNTSHLKEHPFINSKRGNYMEPDSYLKPIISSSEEINKGNIFEKLEGFNKSVSEVISINQQLHADILEKDPTINGKNNVSHKKEYSEFSSSFESIISHIDVQSHNHSFAKYTNTTDKSISTTSITCNVSSEPPLHNVELNLVGKNDSLKKIKIFEQKVSDQQEINEIASLNEVNTYETQMSDQSEKRSIRDSSASSISTKLSNIYKLSLSNSKSIGEQITSTENEKTIESNLPHRIMGETNISNSKTNSRTTTVRSDSSINTIYEPTVLYSGSSVNNTCNRSNNKELIVAKYANQTRFNERKKPMDLNTNESIGRDIYALFNQTDLDLSLKSNSGKQQRNPDLTKCYSSLGMVSNSFFKFFKRF